MTITYYRTGLSVNELQALTDERLPTDARALYISGFRKLVKGPHCSVSITYRQIHDLLIREKEQGPTRRRIATILSHLQRVGLVDKRDSSHSGVTYSMPLALPWGGLYDSEYQALAVRTMSYAACCLYAIALRPFLLDVHEYGHVILPKGEHHSLIDSIPCIDKTGRCLSRSALSKMLAGGIQELLEQGVIRQNAQLSSEADIEPLHCRFWFLLLVASESRLIGLRNQEDFTEWLAAL